MKIDYDELRTDKNHGASYYALNACVLKIWLARGAGLSLLVAGFFGFYVEGEAHQNAMIGFFIAF